MPRPYTMAERADVMRRYQSGEMVPHIAADIGRSVKALQRLLNGTLAMCRPHREARNRTVCLPLDVDRRIAEHAKALGITVSRYIARLAEADMERRP